MKPTPFRATTASEEAAGEKQQIARFARNDAVEIGFWKKLSITKFPNSQFLFFLVRAGDWLRSWVLGRASGNFAEAERGFGGLTEAAVEAGGSPSRMT